MTMTRARQLAFLEDFALGLSDGLSPLQCCHELYVNAQQLGLKQEMTSINPFPIMFE